MAKELTPEEIIEGSGLSSTIPGLDKLQKPKATNNELVYDHSSIKASSEDLLASSNPWEKKADEISQEKMKMDLLQAEQSQLDSARNIQKNAGEAESNYQLLQYANAQNADKYGWSGGSYLDLKNQEAYYKSAITADMYGQMELQREGYRTEMAKAIQAASINSMELANQYYQQEVQNALAISQQTGILVMPDLANDLASWDIANKIIEELKYTPTNELSTAQEQQISRANRIIEQLGAKYANGEIPISTQGLEVLKEIWRESGKYADRTLTSEQIKQLELTTENSWQLAEMELEERAYDKGIIRYRDENNKVVELDMYMGEEHKDFELLQKYYKENPDRFNNVMESFGAKAYQAFSAYNEKLPETDKTTFEKWLANNKVLLEDANEFAKRHGLEEFRFNNTNYTVDQLEIKGGYKGSEMPDPKSEEYKVWKEEQDAWKSSMVDTIKNSPHELSGKEKDKITMDDIYTDTNGNPMLFNINSPGSDLDDFFYYLRVSLNINIDNLGTSFDTSSSDQRDYIKGLYTEANKGNFPENTLLALPINYGGRNNNETLFYLNGEFFMLKDIEIKSYKDTNYNLIPGYRIRDWGNELRKN